MLQKEFNKAALFDNLLNETKTKELGYRFILDEFKRNKWNINLKQAELISTELKADFKRILHYALDLNILNVDNKTRKVLEKERKKTQIIND